MDEAINICREGLEHHPDFFGGRVALAKCYIDKKWWDEARGELERVIATVPENLLAQRLLGDIYLALQNRPSALHCYKMALLLSPNDVALTEKVHALEKGGAADLTELEEEGLAEVDADIDFGLNEAAPPTPPGRPTPAESPGDSLWGDTSTTIRTSAASTSDPIEAEMERMLQASKQSIAEEEEPSEHQSQIDALLGVTETEPEEAYKIEHISAIFGEETSPLEREITTATLGDLYYSQGQFDRALRIFEKLAQSRPNPDLARKINACRASLGVDKDALVRNRKIDMLRSVLQKVRTHRMTRPT